MRLAPNVFDVWAFRRQGPDARFLLLHASEEKARRYFGGGRFWQIPSRVVEDGQAVTDAIARKLNRFGLVPMTIWAGEHAYIIDNRRFAEMQIIGVYAAEVADAAVSCEPPPPTDGPRSRRKQGSVGSRRRTPTQTCCVGLGRDAEAEPVERDLLSMLSEADADHIIAAKLRARYGAAAPRAKR